MLDVMLQTMSERSKGGLGVLFFYVGAGIALAVSVVSGILVTFDIIDRLVSYETLTWYELSSTGMPMRAAFLLVSFVVLVGVVRKMRGVVHEYQGTVWYTLCRTIIFIILTVSVVLVAIAVSVLFGGLFSGDVSLSGFLKSVFVVSVGSVVFYYYRGVLHGVWRSQKKQEQVLVTVVSVFVVGIVVGAVVIFDPLSRPALQKAHDTISCLERLDSRLKSEYFGEKEIPVGELSGDALSDHLLLHDYDPMWSSDCDVAGISYEQIDMSHYRLCASFEVLLEGVAHKYYPHHFHVQKIGENCFERNADR